MTPDSGDSSPSHFGPHEEAPHEQSGDRDRHRHRQHRHEAEIEAAEAAVAREGSAAPKPVATWLTVTSAKAQNPQNTKACASPGSGRWRITLPCSITSQTNWRMRGPSGARLEIRRRPRAPDDVEHRAETPPEQRQRTRPSERPASARSTQRCVGHSYLLECSMRDRTLAPG